MCDAIAVHEAYKQGDLERLKALLGNPPDFPNCHGPRGVGEIILEYAIYHSPIAFVRTLLELGADPNYEDNAGFPSLLAALSSQRPETYEIVELLLRFGADVQQRGVNDYTPLHLAAAMNDANLVRILLSHGADTNARTRIDDFTTPLEEAEKRSSLDAVKILRETKERR